MIISFRSFEPILSLVSSSLPPSLPLPSSLQMNLEASFGGEKANIKVLDRTALILDIFAQHANTKEGKLQVPELLPPLAPRLSSSQPISSHHSAPCLGPLALPTPFPSSLPSLPLPPFVLSTLATRSVGDFD